MSRRGMILGWKDDPFGFFVCNKYQASTLMFVRLSGTSENWHQSSRSCITVVRRDKWKNDCPTFWRLFSIIKMFCFVIYTDINFVNNYFNVFKNIGFHWSTLSLITTMNQEIFQTYSWSVSFQRFHYMTTEMKSK